MEECAEAIQRVTKGIRFGFAEIQDGQKRTNRERLSMEVGDVQCLIHELIAHGLVSGIRGLCTRFKI